ncbi:MAG: hypothetical protein WA063_07355, partial [Minisyncoccia bacterium]
DEGTLAIIKEQLKQNPNSVFDINNFDTIYENKGCEACGKSGHHGRIGIFELLEISPEIKKLILQKAQGNEVKKAATKEGMIPMFEDGLEKTQKGETTITEVLRVVRE